MVKTIDSLRRGIAVLDLLTTDGPADLALLARRTGLAKATLLRILATLEEAGHVQRGLGDRRWRVRPAPRFAAADAAEALLLDVTVPILDRLCQKVLWPSDVGIYRDGAIRVLETSRRLSPFLVNQTVAGGIHVLPSAMGRAILAWTTEAHREEMLADLVRCGEGVDRLAADRGRVAAVLAETRERGYAVRQPGYYISVPREAMVSAIAVPILDGGRAIAAVNLSWVASAVSEGDFIAAHLDALREAADTIGRTFSERSAAPLPP